MKSRGGQSPFPVTSKIFYQKKRICNLSKKIDKIDFFSINEFLCLDSEKSRFSDRLTVSTLYLEMFKRPLCVPLDGIATRNGSASFTFCVVKEARAEGYLVPFFQTPYGLWEWLCIRPVAKAFQSCGRGATRCSPTDPMNE